MFKNQNAFDVEKLQIQQQDLNQEKDLKSNDIVVHTMAKDIQRIEHPESAKKPTLETDKDLFTNRHLTEKQKNSPFIKTASPSMPTSDLKKGSSAQPAPQLSTPKSAPKKIEAPKQIIKKGHQSSLIAFIVLLVIILFASAGIGYFYMTRQQDTDIAETMPAEIFTPTESEFSSENPNYLPVDIENIDKEQLKQIIKNSSEAVAEAEVIIPIEFIITDLQNNPTTFTLFSQKMGLILPENITSKLTENFSLFIFNDAGNMRLGVSIETLSDTNLVTGLLMEEPSLAKNLESLLLSSEDYEISIIDFSEAIYKDILIRYQNIISPEELSIDYALINNQLVIGTTKATMHALIDKALSADDTQPIPTENIENLEQPVDNLLDTE